MLTYSIQDVSRDRQISEPSARVWCSRAVKKGSLFRIKNNLYISRENWLTATPAEKYYLSNIIQVPSYISLSTAITYYELSTQLYQETFEAISQKRSIRYAVQSTMFRYHKLRTKYYQGFVRTNGYFMATPEKALADILYYTSLGRYSFDFSALDRDKINYDRLNTWLKIFPNKTKQLWSDYESS